MRIKTTDVKGTGTKRRYKNWNLEFNPKPIPTSKFDWDFWHDDYDGVQDGNQWCGSGATIGDCLYQIEHDFPDAH